MISVGEGALVLFGSYRHKHEKILPETLLLY